EIPHPFIIESLELFKNLSVVDKNKVYFIHLNHTNPAIDKSSAPFKNITSKGFNVAEGNMEFSL
ncbi:pyrroloquinoline quinone biosynthesis protein PqqB, partial [Flavobacteriaceae bacterium]|nr:pyrroloquinoline quinone biosynthesis protein PqqB [Flavobacteriaceae bacterium]